MSVIINELEVVATPEAATDAQPAAAPAGPAAPPTPLEIRDIIRHLDERRARLAAD